MSKYSLEEFVSQTSEKDHGEGFFELETERILEVNLDGMVWTEPPRFYRRQVCLSVLASA